MAGLRRRLGLDPEPPDPRFAGLVIGACLLLYTAGFFAFYPFVITNDDESIYVDHARILAQGSTTIPKVDPLTGVTEPFRKNFYPVGTALLMIPFVAMGGWQAVYWVPFLSLLGAMLVLARWLHEEGRSPLFSLLLLGFPATLVMGRVAMSDVPNLFVVLLALWLFWRRDGQSPGHWLASGLLAGFSLFFRDTNAVLFAPLYAATVLRRERHWWALLVGGLVGVSLKLLGAHLAFGDPFYLRSEWVPEFENLPTRLSIQLLGLLVAVPGGLVLALCYRGPRWPEVRAAIALFLVFFIIQKHTTYSSGISKRLILDWRYLLGVMPLIVFAMAEAVPRLWRSLEGRWSEAYRPAVRNAAAAVVGLVILGVGAGSLGVHWAFDRWSQGQAQIRDAIHRHTGDDSVLIINRLTTRKYLRNIERPYIYLDRANLSAEDARVLADRYDRVFVVFLDRNDTVYRDADARANQAFIDSLDTELQVTLDQRVSPSERLRIWRLSSAPAG